MTATTMTNQISLLPSIGTIRTLPEELLFTSAQDPSTPLEALVVPPTAEDEDEDEDFAPGEDPGQEDGKYTPPAPNPPPPSK